MAKKIAIAVSLLLELAAIGGVFVLNYFATSRLGMIRWLNYKNQAWASVLPLDVLKMILVVVAAAAAIVLAVAAARRAKSALPAAIWGILLVAVFAVFTLAASTSTFKAYWLMALCLFLAALIQLIQTAALLHSK